MRLHATRHMRVLLRAKMPFFNSWGLELLIPQVQVMYIYTHMWTHTHLLWNLFWEKSYKIYKILMVLTSLPRLQLYDLDKQVALEAVDILDEACEEEVGFMHACTYRHVILFLSCRPSSKLWYYSNLLSFI